MCVCVCESVYVWRPEIRYVFYCSVAYFQDRVWYLEPTTFLTLQDPLVSAPQRWDYRHSLCKMPFPTGPNLAFKGDQGAFGHSRLSALCPRHLPSQWAKDPADGFQTLSKPNTGATHLFLPPSWLSSKSPLPRVADPTAYL